LSGVDFRKQLQTALPRIAIICTTGHGDVPMIVKTMKFGAGWKFRTKPFDGKKPPSQVRVRDFSYTFSIRSLTRHERKVMGLVCVAERPQVFLSS
jgi:hypothetical protein